ncbi:MAG: hypothetical protein H6720_09315 [Sandaracinus sp.]|nr:hypothetical protein [Sandaracinus sp.]
MRFASRALLCASIFVWFGCASDPTRVVVVLEADDEIASVATSVTVQVVRVDGSADRQTVSVGATDAHVWPFRVNVEPIGGDADRRAVVVAEALDAEGESLGLQRAHVGFVRGAVRYVVLRFSGACRQTRCGELQTCVAGACENACVTPGRRPSAPREDGPCLTRDLDAGMDAGFDAGPNDAGTDASDGSLDGSLDDGGVEGGLDAGPPPNPCAAEGTTYHATFEDFPLVSCGEGPCETSPYGRVDVAGPGSVLAPEMPGPCAGSVVRLETLEQASRSSLAYLALPAPTSRTLHVRALVRLASESAAARSAVIGLVAGEGWRTVDVDGVWVRWQRGAAPSLAWTGDAPDEQTLPSMTLPDRWSCLALTLDLDRSLATVEIDGERSAFTLPESLVASFASGAHARVGHFASESATGRERLAWIDAVSVSDVPLGCP